MSSVRPGPGVSVAVIAIITLSGGLCAHGQAREQSDVGAAITDPPPARETQPIAALIDAAGAALRERRATVNDLLSAAEFMPAHEWPRFRSLIRDHAPEATLTLVTPDEPGQPLRVHVTVTRADGAPAAGALVYAYQTSARGWYSDRAAHVGVNSGDFRHARLFGYVRTDRDGRFELRTVRPGGYPRSELPEHIHVLVQSGDEPRVTRETEILFDDDPRLTAQARESALRAGFLICPVETDSAGRAISVRATLSLPAPPRRSTTAPR